MAEPKGILSEIFAFLDRNPTVSDPEEIAARINRNPETVKQYIRKCLNNGQLIEKLEVAESSRPHRVRAYVTIDTVPRREYRGGANYQTRIIESFKIAVAEHYGDRLEICSADMVLGAGIDIVLLLSGETVDVIGHFVKRYVRTNANVWRSVTLIAMPESDSDSPPEATSEEEERENSSGEFTSSDQL
jgi:hypothetical protein